MSLISRTMNWLPVCAAFGFTFSCFGLAANASFAQQQQTQQQQQQGSQQDYRQQQTPAQQPAAGNQNYATDAQIQQAAIPSTPQMPAGFPLSAEEDQYIQQLMSFWEGASTDVQQYACTFRRYQYDYDTCTLRNPQTNRLVAAAISMGNIRYSTPDKGMYEINATWVFKAPPAKAGEDPIYKRPSEENSEINEREKWICDGSAFYEYDFQNKRILETKLPLELQGEGLKNSPLPFVFGAKAADLLNRFWIRDVTPKQLHGQQYWLEAWPKNVTDAQAYKKVEIILSREPFLPIAVHMYPPNYDEKKPNKMVFEFEGRKINGALTGLADFMNNFINPRSPGLGWKRVTQKFAVDPRGGNAANAQQPRTGALPQKGQGR